MERPGAEGDGLAPRLGHPGGGVRWGACTLSVMGGSGRGLSVRAGDVKGPGATAAAGPARVGDGEGRCRGCSGGDSAPEAVTCSSLAARCSARTTAAGSL